MVLDLKSQLLRRKQWYASVRAIVPKVINPDGSGRIAQFNPPWREPLWILPALYDGSASDIHLANLIAARYLEAKSQPNPKVYEANGRQFGIFQSTSLASYLQRYQDKLTPGAQKTMRWHARLVFRTFDGAAQTDFQFHGSNDNMPMMATMGLILGGEALNHAPAIAHGLWNLHQFRRHLSRSAWASEYNSSTYSAITLSCVAKIATCSRSAEIRALARQIEHRLWAEVILHFHPGTFLQAGPQSRAYQVDNVGHTHSLQILLWLVFGSRLSGRDPMESCFRPDGNEIAHFEGNLYQNIAEYSSVIDADFHVPSNIARLMAHRLYPAIIRGRSDCMDRYNRMSAVHHTETYMEKVFSLGTVNGPMYAGEQTLSLMATYRRTKHPVSFRDSATVFCKYFMHANDYDAHAQSSDGQFTADGFMKSQGWFYTIQKNATAMLLSIPDLNLAPITTDTLKLSLIFPAHYGRIRQSIIGSQQPRAGAKGKSARVEPVSIETGEVFIHVQPLMPTLLARKQAIRWIQARHYEALELINYEGKRRKFSADELATCFSGMLLTIQSRDQFTSLRQFHRHMSQQTLITDYYSQKHRFVQVRRPDVAFEVRLSPNPLGIQTETIDGRCVERPLMATNQLQVQRLPFMTGRVDPNKPFFPWSTLEVQAYKNPWIIGSRGLPGEANYSRRKQQL